MSEELDSRKQHYPPDYYISNNFQSQNTFSGDYYKGSQPTLPHWEKGVSNSELFSMNTNSVLGDNKDFEKQNTNYKKSYTEMNQ